MSHAPAPPADSEEPHEKPTSPSKPSKKSRIIANLREFFGKFGEIFRGLKSPDRPTRKMSALFFASLTGMLIVSGLTAKQSWDARKAAIAGIEIDEHAHPGEESEHGHAGVPSPHGSHGSEHGHAPEGATLLDLGAFTLQLKPLPAGSKRSLNPDLAEFTMVLECDHPQTYEYIEQRTPQARNQVTNALYVIDREELLSKEGKQKLKLRILDAINGWLPKGKVQAIYFSKLLAG